MSTFEKFSGKNRQDVYDLIELGDKNKLIEYNKYYAQFVCLNYFPSLNKNELIKLKEYEYIYYYIGISYWKIYPDNYQKYNKLSRYYIKKNLDIDVTVGNILELYRRYFNTHGKEYLTKNKYKYYFKLLKIIDKIINIQYHICVKFKIKRDLKINVFHLIYFIIKKRNNE